MKIRTCDECGKEFDLDEFGLTGNGLKFCSTKCCDDYQDRETEKSASET